MTIVDKILEKNARRGVPELNYSHQHSIDQRSSANPHRHESEEPSGR